MATEHRARHFKLLVNMVADADEAKAVYLNLSQATDRFLKGVVIEYVGFIPGDELMKKAVKNRKPIIDLYPDAVSSRMIKKIAEDLLDWPRRHESDGNIKFFLKRYIDYQAA